MNNSFRHSIVTAALLLASACMGAETVTDTAGVRLSWDWWPTHISSEPIPKEYAHGGLYAFCSLQGLASTGSYAPFLLHTNTRGMTAHTPYSGDLIAGLHKVAVTPCRWYDYEFHLTAAARCYNAVADPFSLRMPAGGAWKHGGVYLPEAYAHVRLFLFDLTAGIAPLSSSVVDEPLSMGGLLLTDNAPSMPRISIGIDRYTAFPGCYGYFELKGGLTHAWLTGDSYVKGAMLHYKYIGFRFGGTLPVNITYECHHAAQWGGYHPTYGDLGNNMKAYINTFFARAGGSMLNDQLNAQGNHLVSQQLMLTVRDPLSLRADWQVDVYWQNLSEDNLIFLGFGQNIADGLWGVRVLLHNQRWVEGITYEFLNTTDQSGPWHDRDGLCYAGSDSYYRNGVYSGGWNSYLHTIGNPYLTSPLYNTDGTLYSVNTRVRVHRAGVRGNIYGFHYRVLASYARNYGNNQYQVHPLTDNWAVLLDVNRRVEEAWDLIFGLRLAVDAGSQFGNRFGAQLTVSKEFNLTSW